MRNTISVERAVDILRHGEKYPPMESAAVEKAVHYLLGKSLTTDEAAEVLRVSRPTILAWIRAGILDETVGSSESKHLVPPLQVFALREILDNTTLHGPLVQRAEQLYGLLEDMFWAAHPEEHDALKQALHDVEKGETIPWNDLMAGLDETYGSIPYDKAGDEDDQELIDLGIALTGEPTADPTAP